MQMNHASVLEVIAAETNDNMELQHLCKTSNSHWYLGQERPSAETVHWANLREKIIRVTAKQGHLKNKKWSNPITGGQAWTFKLNTM